jgi:hypothetical protein
VNRARHYRSKKHKDALHLWHTMFLVDNIEDNPTFDEDDRDDRRVCLNLMNRSENENKKPENSTIMYGALMSVEFQFT